MPSYGLCTDPGDKTQLTDGVFTVGYFWTQKTTVGWGGAGSIPLVITVDLGQVEPICGVGYNTGAGVADVHWPTGIRVLTSDDGKRWYVVGNLAEMDDTAKEPPAPDIYAIHRYATGRLQTRGRYVAFIHETDTYAFCDEVEVYRGTHALPDKPQGRLVGTPEEYHWRGPRLDNELSLIEKRIGSAKLPAGEKGRLGKELDVLRGQCAGAFAPLPAEPSCP